MSHQRSKVIIANWKMHKTIAEARAFITSLAMMAISQKTQVGIAAPFTCLAAAAHAAHGSSIEIGAQNVSDKPDGPYTGEISCQMLKDAGATFVIIGHSERRQLFHESDDLVNEKALRALNEGLQVVMCIGETRDQHQQGNTKTVLMNQLVKGLKNFTPQLFQKLIIAYEPIWAIGTHQNAAPEQAQEVHHSIREFLAQEWGKAISQNLILQYGGSVKTDNAHALVAQPDIDGLLVGGASLNFDSFRGILEGVR